MSDPRLELQTYAFGFMVTQAIAAITRGGVADAVAERPRTVPELAATTGLDEDAFRRVLRALAAWASAGSTTTASSPTRRARSTSAAMSAARCVGSRRASPGSTTASGDTRPRHSNRAAWSPTGRSAKATSTGSRTTQRRPRSSTGPWLQALQSASRRSSSAPGRTSSSWTSAAGPAGSWRRSSAATPGSAASSSTCRTRRRRRRKRASPNGIADRCTFVSGDFFAEVPAGGDVYVLSQILHVWDDEAATRILRTCRAAAESSSRLLILDAVLPEGDGAHLAKLLDLHMLVLLGGRERTEAEWRVLLRAGGFELERAEVTGATGDRSPPASIGRGTD